MNPSIAANPPEVNELTVGDLMARIVPTYIDQKVPRWPADVFAVAGLILKSSGAYADIVRDWPPNGTALDPWNKQVRSVANRWRVGWRHSVPGRVTFLWKAIISAADIPIARLRTRRIVVDSLLELIALADEACRGVGFVGTGDFSVEASTRLEKASSLSLLADPSWLRVLPKTHNARDGLTFRSLTHHLALWINSEVDARWKHYPFPSIGDHLNMLLLPWPLFIHPRAFSEARKMGSKLPPRNELFTYDVPAAIDIAKIQKIADVASSLVGPVHAMVLPELSMQESEFQRLRDAFPGTLLIAGVGTPALHGFGSNKVAIAPSARYGATHLQCKHHRWRVDSRQFTNYGLKHTFKRDGSWLEAIDLPTRSCTFFNVNDWLTFSVLICEDLARQDPVAELVRTVGPSLVIALLMDGPQLTDRWSARYATVLAEDPRSSVLTLTSAGMVDLSNAQFGGMSPRSIALWRDATSSSPRQIHLQEGAEGVILRLGSQMVTEWTADGRDNVESTGYVTLDGIVQVTPSLGANPVARATSSKRGAVVKSKRGSGLRKGK
jgi:hypothetical protein